MAVDPGGVSGCARGVFVSGSSLAETLQGHDIEAWTVEGDPEVQAWEIAAEWLDWSADLRLSGVGGLHLVIESFALRQMAVELSPVMVAAGIRTLLIPRAVALGVTGGSASKAGPVGRAVATGLGWKLDEQSPGDAKTFATTARLKEWGMYALGRGGGDHKRDALRHLALRVARIESGDVAEF